MKRGVALALAAGAGLYWASRQPGGIPGTWARLKQGVRDIAAGQDPLAVGRRFVAGTDEEPAGAYASEASTTGYQQPFSDYVTSEG